MKLGNTTTHDICLSADGESVVIPMAKEQQDAEGKLVIVNGTADVPDSLLEALSDNPVVKYYFQEKKLVEEAANQPEQVSVDPALQEAVDAAKAAVQAAMDKVAKAPDAKSKTAAEKDLATAQQTLADAEAALGG